MTSPHAHRNPENTAQGPRRGRQGHWGTRDGARPGASGTPAADQTATFGRVQDAPPTRRAHDSGGHAARRPQTAAQDQRPERDGSEDSRRVERGGNWLLIALVALALVASVIMLITDSSIALRLALLAALWAAVIGFFLVTRYRRAADTARRELEHTRQLAVARAERDRAQAASGQAATATPGPATLRAEDMAVLTEIRESLKQLREQLEQLQGHALEYEPAALRAQAWRLQELEARAEAGAAGQPHAEKTGDVKGAPSVDAVAGKLGEDESAATRISPELADLLRADSGARTGRPRQADPAPHGATVKEAPAKETTPQETAAKHAPQHSERPAAARPYEAAQVTRAEQAPEERGQHRRPDAPAADAAAPAGSHRRAADDQKARHGHGRHGDGARDDAQPAEPRRTGGHRAAEPAPDDEGGKRRADGRAGALTVAELLQRRNS